MTIRISGLGYLAHKLKHCSQFERGEISYGSDRDRWLYDISDEESAYRRENLFHFNMFDKNQYVYRNLRTTPVDINTLDPSVTELNHRINSGAAFRYKKKTYYRK